MSEYTEKELSDIAGVAFGQTDTGLPIMKTVALNELANYLCLFNDETLSGQVSLLKVICQNCLLKSPLKELSE